MGFGVQGLGVDAILLLERTGCMACDPAASPGGSPGKLALGFHLAEAMCLWLTVAEEASQLLRDVRC